MLACVTTTQHAAAGDWQLVRLVPSLPQCSPGCCAGPGALGEEVPYGGAAAGARSRGVLLCAACRWAVARAEEAVRHSDTHARTRTRARARTHARTHTHRALSFKLRAIPSGNQFFLLLMVARYLPALMEVKPAVTLAVGGSLVGFHFRLLGNLPYLYGRAIQDVCLMPGAILYDVELLRFVTGVLTHFSDYHLYWALGSLASKGLALEPRIGSKNFGTLLLALTVLTSAVTVVLSFSMYNLLGDHGWMKNCYLGGHPTRCPPFAPRNGSFQKAPRRLV